MNRGKVFWIMIVALGLILPSMEKDAAAKEKFPTRKSVKGV